VRIPVALAPDLLAQRLDDSIYDLLTERYGVVVVKAVERMVAVLTDRDRAELLGIDVGDPLMAIERVSYDDSDRPVEYSTDLFRGDRTRIIAWAHGASQPQQASVPATPDAPGEPG
jgi:GntR family transcriptional regulator